MLTGKGLDARVVACGAGGLVQADTSHADVALEETRAGTRTGAAAASDTHKWILRMFGTKCLRPLPNSEKCAQLLFFSFNILTASSHCFA